MTTKSIVRIVLALSVAALAGTLAWGVVDGRLSMRTPASAAGATVSRAAGAASGGARGDVRGGVLALSEDRRRILVLDPGNGSVRGTIDLEQPAAHIAPTPGGVSVFVTFSDTPEIRVYSTTDYGLQERITLEGGTPDTLTFSENGGTLFVTYRESARVSVFSHSQRKLSEPYHFEAAGTAGPAARNRRATRLYRQSDSGLGVIYAQNGAIIETLDVDAAGWRFNPIHTHLWGVGADGRPRVVAERSGNITLVQQELADVAASAALAVVRVGGPSVGGPNEGAGRVAALLAGGESIAILHGATAEELAEIELPFAARRIAPTGVGTLWALSADGRIAVIDPVAGSVTAVEETGGLRVAALAPSIVKEEGNFACF